MRLRDLPAWITAARNRCRGRRPQIERSPITRGSFGLDQFQGFAAGAFDHDRASIVERVELFEEGDALAAQFLHPRVEIGDTQGDVVLQLPARADERSFALVRVPHHRDIAKLDPGPRGAAHPLPAPCRPGPVGSPRYLT